MPNGKQRLYIGTYTPHGDSSPEEAESLRSEGIYSAELDLETGELSGVTLAVPAKNSSYIALSPDVSRLFAVHEFESTVSSYSVQDGGKLERIDTRSSEGTIPCHLSLSSDGKTLYVANYGDGVLTEIPVSGDGRLGEPRHIFKNEGCGPNAARQSSPHAHFITPSPDDVHVYSCDLGTDEVLVFRTEEGLVDPERISTPPGVGPRHLVLAGERVHVACEILPSLLSLHRGEAHRQLGLHSTLAGAAVHGAGPQEQPSTASAIHLHPNGRWIYVSNRGEETLAHFEQDDEAPVRKEVVPAGVHEPRDFAISSDGRWLVVAGQNSDNLRSFAIAAQTGALTPTGHEVQVPKPCCLVFSR